MEGILTKWSCLTYNRTLVISIIIALLEYLQFSQAMCFA
jgi:hypothetical protein